MSNFETLKDFQKRFETLADEPFEDMLERRMMYLVEECKETVDAAEGVLEALDTGGNLRRAKAELAKELVDVLYVSYGFLHLLGVDADKAFAEVHASNMSKTPHPNGGKAVKGPDFKKAEMEQFVA
jgi:predicted HAD superfamily Cof-like phosphohydrolase